MTSQDNGQDLLARMARRQDDLERQQRDIARNFEDFRRDVDRLRRDTDSRLKTEEMEYKDRRTHGWNFPGADVVSAGGCILDWRRYARLVGQTCGLRPGDGRNVTQH